MRTNAQGLQEPDADTQRSTGNTRNPPSRPGCPRTLCFHLLGGCRYLSMPSVSPGSSRTPKTVSSSAWADGGQRRRLLAAFGRRQSAAAASLRHACGEGSPPESRGSPGASGRASGAVGGPHGLPRARPLCACAHRLDARMATGCGASSCALSATTLLTTSLSTPWPRRTWSGVG